MGFIKKAVLVFIILVLIIVLPTFGAFFNRFIGIGLLLLVIAGILAFVSHKKNKS